MVSSRCWLYRDYDRKFCSMRTILFFFGVWMFASCILYEIETEKMLRQIMSTSSAPASTLTSTTTSSGDSNGNIKFKLDPRNKVLHSSHLTFSHQSLAPRLFIRNKSELRLCGMDWSIYLRVWTRVKEKGRERERERLRARVVKWMRNFIDICCVQQALEITHKDGKW